MTEPSAPETNDGPRVRRPRILLGDSEAWSSDLFRQAAEAFGADLHVALNGVDALEKFKILAPSLVVLDSLLPKLDGLQAAAKIRDTDLGRITPVVVTSAMYRPGEDVDRLQRKFGFTEFLPKPFRVEDLASLFEQHLREETEHAAPDSDLYEDGRPLGRTEGSEMPLVEMGVPALLCQLFRGRRSGTLTVRRGEITKVVFFEQGHITHARSNSKRDRLGRILLRGRRITLEDYERARRLQTEASGRLQLGAALVQLGVLTDNDVANAVVSQILSVLFSLFEWDSGAWSFLDSTSVPAEYTRFNFNTANLIFWGLRQLEGRQSFGRFLPGPRVLLERQSDVQRFKEQLNLTFLEEQVLSVVDGKKRLGEILAIGKLARVDVERVVFSLLVLGVLRTVTDLEPAQAATSTVAGQFAVAEKGTLLSTSVTRLFSRLHLGAQTGVVNLSGGWRDASVYFDGGEIVYARSSEPQHRIGEILLRSGSIAQADHDRALQQLGDGHERKIGTVLLDMRAISLEELHSALRLQVQDIVLDLFRWKEGEYQYEVGDSAPEMVVSLPATTTNLIMEGARLCDVPPGILSLLDQPDTMLMKLWGDEPVMQKLQLSASERRLLSFVESGRSAREVKALGLMPEAELGRSLHGLLALEVMKAMSGATVTRPPVGDAASGVGERSGVDSFAAEDTPFPPNRPALRIAVDSPVAAAAVALDERGRMALENSELRERNTRLEREVAALKQAFARYYDLKEGDGAGARFVAQALGARPDSEGGGGEGPPGGVPPGGAPPGGDKAN